MSDQTPSPQSVVVPVEPTLATFETPDFAARTHAPHMEGWAYNQMPKAGWSDLKLFQYDGTDLYQWFGKKTGSVFEDAEGEPFAIKPAAPAPSSLAGGEVLTLRTLLDNLVIAQSLSKEIRTHATDEARAYLYDTRLAALSPEAPARDTLPEDDELPGDFLARVGMDGALWATEFRKMALKLGYSDMDEGWLIGWFCNAVMAGYDHAQRKFDPALTPRHEAPACETCNGRGEVGGFVGADSGYQSDPCPDCGDEAPAEGAGEVVGPDSFSAEGKFFLAVDYLTLMTWRWGESCGIDNVGWDDAGDSYNQSCRDDHRKARRAVVDAFHAAVEEKSALRARSSAPEAREEALGNLLAVIHGDGGHRALEVGTKQAALEAEKIVAGLFAAPSADKLREVLIDLTSWFTKPVQGQNGMVWVIRAGEMGADDALNAALAALKAEGC